MMMMMAPAVPPPSLVPCQWQWNVDAPVFGPSNACVEATSAEETKPAHDTIQAASDVVSATMEVYTAQCSVRRAQFASRRSRPQADVGLDDELMSNAVEHSVVDAPSDDDDVYLRTHCASCNGFLKDSDAEQCAARTCVSTFRRGCVALFHRRCLHPPVDEHSACQPCLQSGWVPESSSDEQGEDVEQQRQRRKEKNKRK